MSIKQTQDGFSAPVTHFCKSIYFTLFYLSTLFVFACNVSGASTNWRRSSTPIAAPPSISFTASPATVAAGGTVTLAYTLTGATSATLSNGSQSGSVPATSDLAATNVRATTTYTLTAVGAGGTVSKSITVTVKAAAAAPAGTVPVITSFAASPGTIAAGGNSVLSWTVTGTSPTVTLNGVAATSPTTVKPSATTSYLLTAANSAGSVNGSAIVTITPANSSSPTGTSLTDCQSITQAGTYYLANDVSSAGTCFPIGANNVTLNLNGHTITYGTGGGTAPTPAFSACASWYTGLTTTQCLGDSTGLTVYGGKIVQSANAAPFSPVFWMGEPGSYLHDLTATFQSVGSQFYYGVGDGGNNKIQNNVINDNVTNIQHPGQPPLGARSQFQGYVIHTDEEGSTAINPDDISGNTINGSPQGGIADGEPNSQIYNNKINLTSYYSNDYGVIATVNGQNVHDNTIAGRGRGLSGESSGFVFNHNTINVAEQANNSEYGGCELDGTYGIRVKDYSITSDNFQITNNTVNVPATACPSTAMDLTDMAPTVTGTISGNQFSAPAGAGGLANALGLEGVNAANILFQANSFTAPTCLLIGGNGDIPYGPFTVQSGQTWSCPAAPTVFAQDYTYGQTGGTPPIMTIQDSIPNPTASCWAYSTAVITIGNGFTYTCDLKGQ